MQQTTEKKKTLNPNIFKTPCYYGVVAVIFIALLPFITGDYSYFERNFDGYFYDFLCVFYIIFIILGAIIQLLGVKKYGKRAAINIARYYSWVLLFICGILFVYFFDQSQEFYFGPTYLLHAIICGLGIIINALTATLNPEISLDKPKVRHYCICFIVSFIGAIMSINTITNINYDAWLGAWVPSILFFAIAVAISSYKMFIPINHNDYFRLSNRPIALRREINFPHIMIAPAFFLLAGGISLLIERSIFDDLYLSYYSGGFVEGFSALIPFIAVGLFVHRGSYNKKQAAYIAMRTAEEKAEKERKEKQNKPAETKPVVDQKYVPWFMPMQNKKFTFNNDLSLAEIASDFADYANECGICLRDDDIRAIFASLATTKFLIFNGANKQAIDKIISVIAGYFGSSLYIQQETQSWIDKGSIIESDNQNEKVSELVKGIYLANTRSNNISIVEFNDVAFENFDNYLSEILNQACDKNLKNNIKIRTRNKVREESFVKEGKMQVPGNLVFALNLAHGETLENATKRTTLCSHVININDYDCENVNVTPRINNLVSYRNFCVLVDAAWDELYMGETLWRKVDKVSEYLNEKLKIKIDNPTAIAFEKYTSVYLALGGKEEDAVDHLMSSFMLHKYSFHVADMEIEDLDDIYEAIDNAFGIDNTPLTGEYIKLFRLAKANGESNRIIKKDSPEYKEFSRDTENESDDEGSEIDNFSAFNTVSSDEENGSLEEQGSALDDLFGGTEDLESKASEEGGLADLFGGAETSENKASEESGLADLFGGAETSENKASEESGFADLFGGAETSENKPSEESGFADLFGGAETSENKASEESGFADLFGGTESFESKANEEIPFTNEPKVETEGLDGGRNLEGEEKLNDLLSDMLFSGEDEEGDK